MGTLHQRSNGRIIGQGLGPRTSSRRRGSSLCPYASVEVASPTAELYRSTMTGAMWFNQTTIVLDRNRSIYSFPRQSDSGNLACL
jgi:hypothetical protein